MEFNTQQLEDVKESSTGVYTAATGIFDAFKSLKNAVGDNDISVRLDEEGKKVEESFNDYVLPAFISVREALMQSVTNHEALSRFMANMESVSTAGIASASVDAKVGEATFV